MTRESSVSAARARPTGRGAGATVALLALTATACAALVGCGSTDPLSSPPATATSTASTPASPTSGPPEFDPHGSADDNLALFTEVVAEAWASEHRASGRAYVDALAEAGFDKDRMQLTADRTTVGNPAESIQFSVAWGDTECLIGQVGPSTGDPVTAVLPQLAQGRCLIGDTRPIDW